MNRTMTIKKIFSERFHELTNIPRRRLFAIIAMVAFILTNLPVLGEEIRRLYRYNQVLDHNIIGYQFRGLEEFIPENVTFISYITDGDLQAPDRYKLFTQAQFVLAPTILDPENPNHQHVLLVFQDETHAWQTIKHMNRMPILKNDNYGIIFAQRR
jgi:hypothetical protein